MRLAGNQNESEIGNSTTRRCDWGGATRGSWVRGPIVGSWVRRSWVVGSPFVGSLFMGSWVRGFAIRGFAVHGSWVRCSWARGFVGSPFVGSPFVGSTISSWRSHRWCNDLNFLGSRSLSLSVCAWVLSLSLSLFARLRKWFEAKIWAENHFRWFWLILRSNWKYFQFDPIYHSNQKCYFPKNDFRILISVKTNGRRKCEPNKWRLKYNSNSIFYM